MSKKGYHVFVISNQAGVGKGIYPQETLDTITARMVKGVEKTGGRFAGIYYCTHRPDADCVCRKPKAGMIEKARREHGISRKGSFFIGDTIRDIHTAQAAGCTSILVLSGKEKISNRHEWELQPDFICRDLYEAAQLILRRNTKKENQ